MTKNNLTISIGLIILLPLAAMNNARACTACGNILSKDWGIQGVSTHPGFTADLSYSYINQSQQRYGFGTASAAKIGSLSAAGQEIEDYTITRTTTAALNYSSDTWGVNIQLPFVQRTHGTFGEGNWPATTGYATSNESGIGDISAIGRYTGFSADKTAGIIAGIKLPTGNTGANFNDGVTALDRSLQIGSGSTDLILGGFFSGTANEYGWFAQGKVQHAVATKSIAGADYSPGDTYTLNTGIRYAKFGAQFTPMLQLSYIHRRPDTGTGATAPDSLTGGSATGGTLIYLAPGASFRVGGGTSVYGFVQLPVYQNVNSLQLSPHYTVTFGIKHAFE